MLKKFLVGTFAVAALALALTVSAAYDFGTTTLRVGSKGAAVMAVQTVVGASVDGSYGPMTKAAVMAWQANNGLTADGVFGPMSMAKANAGGTYPAGCTSTAGYSSTTGQSCATVVTGLPAGCTSTVGYSSTTGAKCDGGTTSTPTGPLTGTFGTISTMTQLSQYNAEEVGSGQNDVKVSGFEVKASNDGDIKLTSMKLTFDANGYESGDSTRIADYVDAVSIWMGSTKVGSADASDFTRDSTGVYTKTVSLDGAVIRADVTEKFYIAIDSVNNLDSGDINLDSWTVGVNNIRYEDGAGVVTTDTLSYTNAANIDWDAAADGVAINFVTFSSAADTELKLSLNSSSPIAGVSKVNTTTNTDGVVLAKGKMKLEGTSDVWLDEVRVYYLSDATDIDQITNTVYLTIDGEEFSETLSVTNASDATVLFDNLDLDITAGDTIEFTLSADVNDIEALLFLEGKYLSASIDTTQRALMVVENSQGEALTDNTEVTGTTMGNKQYFYSVAPTVSVVSASITPNDNGSNPAVSATAKMKLKIVAEGGTVYLNGDDETTQAKEFFGIAVDGGDASTSISATGYTFTPSGTYTVTNSGADEEYYTLYDGDTMYVDIEAVVVEAVGSSSILVGMKGDEIRFGTADTSDTTRSANAMTWTSLTDILKTGKTTLDS